MGPPSTRGLCFGRAQIQIHERATTVDDHYCGDGRWYVHCRPHISLLGEQAELWREVWGAEESDKDMFWAELPAGDPPPLLTPQHIRAAPKAFSLRTAAGIDGFHPRHLHAF